MTSSLAGYTSGRGWSKILGPTRYKEPPKMPIFILLHGFKNPKCTSKPLGYKPIHPYNRYIIMSLPKNG